MMWTMQERRWAPAGGPTLKRAFLGALTVTLSLGVTTAAPAHAAGQRGHCVSQSEYQDVKKGWRQSRVANHFDTNGILMTRWNNGGDTDAVWKYRKCSEWGPGGHQPGGTYVGIWFNNYQRDTDGNHYQRVNKKVPSQPGRLAAEVDDLFG